MAELNEAGLSAAEAVVMNMPHSRGPDPARQILEAYFEHAEVDTKRRLHPQDRTWVVEGRTHKFSVGSVEGYLTVNCFPDGKVGEVFVHGIGKEGSTVTGLMDTIAILFSVGLQYGVPMHQMTKFMKGMTFEPNDIGSNSLVDYIACYLEENYGY